MFPANFVIGAAVGAATTYVFKDEPAKQKLIASGRKLKEGASSFMASFRKKPEIEADDVVEVVTEEVPAETIVDEVEQEAATAKA